MRPKFQQIGNQSYTLQIYERLKESIITLDLRPGQVLAEEQLAEQFATSRTPVREALAQLAAEGLVDSKPHREKRVAELTLQRAREAFELKVAVEAHALKLVGPELGAEDIERARSLLHQCEEASDRGDYMTWAELNDRFHRFFVRKTGLSMMMDVLENIDFHIQRSRVWMAHNMTRRQLKVMDTYHTKILESVAAGEVHRATDHLDEHMRIFLQFMGEMMGERQKVSEESADADGPSTSGG